MTIDKNDFWLEKLRNSPVCGEEREEFFRVLKFLESPKDSRKYINYIERGNKEEQQTNTYNELALGYLLKKNGYTLEYEKEINFQSKVKTPDWFVNASEVNPEFIVEVFSTYIGSDHITRSENLQMKLLKERLEKIKFDGVLYVKCNRSKLDDIKGKNIAEKMKSILFSRSLIYNFDYYDEDLDFEYRLIKSNTGLLSLRVMTIEAIREISQKTLFRNISDKTKKYKDASIPLVIAAFTDMQISQQIKEESHDIVNYLKEHNSISAFLWIDRIHPYVDGWTINIIYGNKSKLKLQNIFKNEKHLFSDSDIVCNHVIQEIGLNRSKKHDILKKKLIESNFRLTLKNNSNMRWHYHWVTPIGYREELIRPPAKVLT